MSDEVTMKYCPFIECGGKLQPHSIDSATGCLDCDGPCSPRRVQMWKDNLKQPKPKPEPKPEYKLVIPPEYSHMTAEEYEAYLRTFLWEG